MLHYLGSIILYLIIEVEIYMTDKLIDLDGLAEELFATVHQRMPELSEEMISILKDITKMSLAHGFKVGIKANLHFNTVLLESIDRLGGSEHDKGTGE
jgi:hypothetical protein